MPDFGLLRTTTFRVALLYLGLFLASVLVILGLIYWFTAGFIERQTDETIAAEIAGLREQYRQRRLPGLIEVVNARSAVPRTSTLYLVATPTFTPLAGNLSDWPDAEPDAGRLDRVRDRGRAGGAGRRQPRGAGRRLHPSRRLSPAGRARHDGAPALSGPRPDLAGLGAAADGRAWAPPAAC